MNPGFKEFLTALFSDAADGNIEIRVLPSGVRAFGTLYEFAELAAFVESRANENVYFGVAPRVEKNGVLKGGAANCGAVRALWIDIDFKQTPESEARALLDVCPAPPSIVVHSGGGLHAYWLLKEGLAADATLKSWLRRLALTMKADLQAAEPARILRLPGTLNHKYTPPRLVRIETFEPTRRYALADFAWLRDEPAPTTAPSGLRAPTRSLGVINEDKAVNILSHLWPNGQRHDFARHIGGWFAHNGVAEEDAVRIVRAAEETAQHDQPAEPDDRERAVRDSYAKHAAGAPVTGFTSACQIVPELQVMGDALKDALGIVPTPRISVEDAAEEPDAALAGPLALPAEARIGLPKIYADLYAEAFESPWECLFFAFLTHLGARVAKHVRLDNALGTEPRLYTVLLGQSARARKTQAMKLAAADFAWADLGRAPSLAAVEPEPGEFAVLEGVGSGEAVAQWLLKTDLHTGLLQIDELGHLFGKMKIEGSSLLSILLTLFDRTTWNNNTKDKPLQLRGTSLSLLAACVADVFPDLFDSQGADQGLVNRLWLVTGPTSLTPRFDPQVPNQAAMRGALHRLLTPYQQMKLGESVVAVRTDEARRIYQDWYETEFHPCSDERMSRLDTYVERLTMLLAVCAGEPGSAVLVVTPEIAQAAVSMARWQFQVRQRYTPIIADTRAARVEQAILRAAKRAGEQGATERQLQKATNAHRVGRDAWTKAFEALQRNGNLAPLELVIPAGRGGRPASRRWLCAFE